MLTLEELKQLNDFFSLNIKSDTVQKISGGDVNETYLAVSHATQYIIKKIDDKAYARDYKVTVAEIISSIEFSEHIAQQLLYTEQVSSALFTKQGCVLKTETGLFIVYPCFSGTVKENEALSLEMIDKIANFLALIHHSSFTFDTAFASKKLDIFKNIGNTIIELSLWNKISKLTHKTYFFPKLHQVAQYLLTNKECLHSAIRSLEGQLICHNDLKPKNVLWKNEQYLAIIDWETAGLFDVTADYLDTLLAWCTHYDEKKIFIHQEKLQKFLLAYPIAHDKLERALPVVLVKWYFWLACCVKKVMDNPRQWRHYYWHIRYSIHFIIFLISGEVFTSIKKTSSNPP